jgi:hypothetical protein
MSCAVRSNGVRSQILELVGSGHSADEIRELVGPLADEGDLGYAESLVRVRDEVRKEKLSRGITRTRSGA